MTYTFTIEIEHGVPIPKHPQRRECAPPFAVMQVGDSFVEALPARDRRTVHHAACALQGWARWWRSTAGVRHRYVTRHVPEGIRIWRVA